ncbi:carbon-monoxide dehydrogenase medium subunit [Kibdelosporangium banguiense]|uniref:Carbon-monoxide dehydrogenase medium subunit n=1 Tax=Kibdelosporangium banguiense TaxID=1365924 RepID=A0ABS4TLA2_9PSEU|nr:xanthine dehydrogenase family protein subunit M [Kibdelosporangium banguiense]MBP2325109.1 carbon-monoxide dehydrogenase medium subunit [Kibdelosporangium banguiense]
MYPSQFRYEAPRSLDEALELMRSYGDEAKVLAGGQSLVPMIKLRFAAPEVLVDINGVPGLDYHDVDADGVLRVGALCRHADLEFSAELRDRQPTMAAAAPLIADPLVRNRGTLVGSVCHADPQGDWASVMLALNAEILVASAAGRRAIPMAEFVLGPFQTALEPGEIAVEARVPAAAGTRVGRYLKLERRVGDFATVGVAVALEINGGKVAGAGIALTGVGPNNIKAVEAERVLAGTTLEPDVVAEAARLAAQAAEPRTDHRGSAAYKRQVVKAFVTRGLSSSLVEAA